MFIFSASEHLLKCLTANVMVNIHPKPCITVLQTLLTPSPRLSRTSLRIHLFFFFVLCYTQGCTQHYLCDFSVFPTLAAGSHLVSFSQDTCFRNETIKVMSQFLVENKNFPFPQECQWEREKKCLIKHNYTSNYQMSSI